MTRLLCLLLIALTGAAHAQELDELRDQGKLYYQRDQYKQARLLLDKAYARADGKADFQTCYYRGLVAHELLLLEEAFQMAAEAKVLAKEDRETEKVQELQATLDALYGKITIKASENETNLRGRIYLESQTGIINRKKKQQFNTIRERFRSTDITVPVSIYLPFGNYRINEVPVALEQGGETPEIAVILQKVGGEDGGGGGGGVSGWIWAGVGTLVAAGGVVAFFLLTAEPDPKDELRIDFPFEQ